MTLFRDKYRIETTRLKTWDYANDGWYFITICTQARAQFFGTVRDDALALSSIGQIAAENWHAISAHFKHVALDVFVVMPNHIHGIVIIDKQNFVQPTSERRPTPETVNQFGPLKPGSLQAVVHAYKASVTRWCRKNDQVGFRWQPLYYDHIIRDERSLLHIRTYIENNPARWLLDRAVEPGLWM